MSAKRPTIVILSFDFLIALFAFWISGYFGDLPRWYYLVAISAIWVLVSFSLGKLNFGDYKQIRFALEGIIGVDVILGLIIYLLYTNLFEGHEQGFTIFIATGIIIVLELLLYWCFRMLVYRKIPFFYEIPTVEDGAALEKCGKSTLSSIERPADLDKILDIVRRSSDKDEVCRAIDQVTDFKESTVVLRDSNPETVLCHKSGDPLGLVVECCSLNDVRHINTLLSYANYCMADKALLVCHCTTASIRKERIMRSNPLIIRQLAYALDYLLHRVVAKLPLTKDLYFAVTKGRNRALTRVEVLGRIYRAGFDVIQEEIVGGELCVVSVKCKAPIRDDKPSIGIFIRLRRKGLGGKEIGVYKLRTMHSYSEYIQPYIFRQDGLCEGGKIADDYRVSSLGRFLRKCWLDELPMILNWIIGDLKLVGVRPLSDHYFSLYSKELQELRIKVKPGLVPPFYVDMPKTLPEIEASETRYLKSYLQAPLRTDWRYFWKAVSNIVFKGKRSK